MFGTLRPHLCSLSDQGEAAYRRLYCGTCKSLGQEFGLPFRALLSHDAVFLALLADGLLDEAAPEGSCRCPMNPLMIRPILEPGTAPMRFAAGAQLLLADQWLGDREADGKRLARAARPLLAKRVRAARAALGEVGVDTGAIVGFEARQADAEVAGVTAPADAAAPTAAALEHVFAQVAELPGAAAELRSDAGRRQLSALGRAVGTAIYALDALEDLRKDAVRSEFNPCLERAPDGGLVVSPERVEACARLLEEAVRSASAGVRELPWRRHREVVRNVIDDTLTGRARDAVRAARALAASERERRWLHAVSRLAAPARVLALLPAVLAAWFARVGRGARALLAPRPSSRRRAPDAAGGAACGAPHEVERACARALPVAQPALALDGPGAVAMADRGADDAPPGRPPRPPRGRLLGSVPGGRSGGPSDGPPVLPHVAAGSGGSGSPRRRRWFLAALIAGVAAMFALRYRQLRLRVRGAAPGAGTGIGAGTTGGAGTSTGSFDVAPIASDPSALPPAPTSPIDRSIERVGDAICKGPCDACGDGCDRACSGACGAAIKPCDQACSTAMDGCAKGCSGACTRACDGCVDGCVKSCQSACGGCQEQCCSGCEKSCQDGVKKCCDGCTSGCSDCCSKVCKDVCGGFCPCFK